jgi:hypothetical protein
MTKRSRIVAFGFAGLLVLAGGAGASILTGTLGQVLALALIGLGLVLATSLIFLEVGLGEDRERARDAAAGEPSRGSRHRPRMERMRGRPRRLK